jgi:hypothetical protein
MSRAGILPDRIIIVAENALLSIDQVRQDVVVKFPEVSADIDDKPMRRGHERSITVRHVSEFLPRSGLDAAVRRELGITDSSSQQM